MPTKVVALFAAVFDNIEDVGKAAFITTHIDGTKTITVRGDHLFEAVSILPEDLLSKISEITVQGAMALLGTYVLPSEIALREAIVKRLGAKEKQFT